MEYFYIFAPNKYLNLCDMKKHLLLLVAVMIGVVKTMAYDFSSVCPTGQTLYYNITSTENHTVDVATNNWCVRQYDYPQYGGIPE